MTVIHLYVYKKIGFHLVTITATICLSELHLKHFIKNIYVLADHGLEIMLRKSTNESYLLSIIKFNLMWWSKGYKGFLSHTILEYNHVYILYTSLNGYT